MKRRLNENKVIHMAADFVFNELPHKFQSVICFVALGENEVQFLYTYKERLDIEQSHQQNPFQAQIQACLKFERLYNPKRITLSD